MPRYSHLLILLATLAFSVSNAAPALALNARSWVASFGDDGNTCVRTSPCGTFTAALNQTNPGGEINCVDQGEFGGPQTFIGKSVTIDCESAQGRNTGQASQLVVLVSAAATDVIVLRGLDISGNGVSEVGIYFGSGGALHIEKCVIHDVNASPAWGIALAAATASTTMELYVTDTVVMNNAGTASSAGIMVQPLKSNTVNKVILNRVEARNNFMGIKADGTQASGGVINMTVRDSVASGNSANGIVGTTNAGGAAVVMMVDRSTASHNGAGYGVIADGANARIEMTHSTASGNNFGIGASNGGQLISYQDNKVSLNSTDGSPTSVISFK